jgi:hypothetical protein
VPTEDERRDEAIVEALDRVMTGEEKGSEIHFANDWVTAGWTRDNGRWVEAGTSRSAKVPPASSTPVQLTIHEVADRLNLYESMLREIPNMVRTFTRGFGVPDRESQGQKQEAPQVAP